MATTDFVTGRYFLRKWNFPVLNGEYSFSYGSISVFSAFQCSYIGFESKTRLSVVQFLWFPEFFFRKSRNSRSPSLAIMT